MRKLKAVTRNAGDLFALSTHAPKSQSQQGPPPGVRPASAPRGRSIAGARRRSTRARTGVGGRPRGGPMNAPGPSERATSFGAWADEYDDWRPTYPDAAVDWLVPPDGARVVEVGAGTGKLTDRLSERDLDLDVVEPDRRMLAIISQRHPRLRTHETGATSLPLAEASVDAVLVADAWHWFPKYGKPLRRSPASSGQAAGSAAFGTTRRSSTTGSGRR